MINQTKQKGSSGANDENLLNPRVKSSRDIKENTFIINAIAWSLICENGLILCDGRAEKKERGFGVCYKRWKNH
jgi:hypothetical protein